MAGDHALLALLRGNANSNGLREIRFHYPLQGDREKELAKAAIETIDQYHFQVGFYWALIDQENYNRFLDHLRTLPGASQETVMILDDVMHGKIGFNVMFRFDGFIRSQKDSLVERIMAGGINPSDRALDAMFSIKKDIEFFNASFTQTEIEAEIRRTFARNLEFYSE